MTNQAFRFVLPGLVLLASFVVPVPTYAATASPDVVRATLANGLQVLIVRNRLAPVVTTEINYRVGSNEAPAGFPGMAHAQEHMMFRGSPGLSAGQLAEIGADMGGQFDADTQQGITQYMFTVPARDLDMALHVEAIRMAGVLDSEALWRKERGAIEQEVAQDLSDPGYVFYTKLLATMFKGTPYAHDALGTTASFNRTTGAMLQRFHRQWYAPNNAVLVIVGDVQPQAVLAQVKSLFGGIPARKLPARPAFHFAPMTAQTLHLDTNKSYGTTVLAFRMPGYDSPDYAAAVVLADVLSSARGNLYGLVADGKALSADFSYDAFGHAGIGFATGAFPKGGKPQAVLTDMRQVLRDYLSKGVPAELVAAAKRREEAAVEFEKNSVSGLASAWSQAVAVEGRHSPADDVKAIRAVTPAEVNRVARRYLDFDHAITAVLTPKASGRPVSAKGFGGKESFAPKTVKAVTLPEWARKDINRLSVPASTVHPVVYTLHNGIKLIVQPEHVSHTVSVYGHIDNRPDLEQPGGQEGVDTVLGALFDYGSKHLDRMAYQKALDAIAADESAGTDFSLQVLAGHFDRGVALLADNELHPALPATAFRTVQHQIAAAVAGREQSPGYLTGRALRTALVPKHDPLLRTATPQSVATLSLDEVKQYYRRVFRPDMTTIVVIGDVSPAHARQVIEKYFGGWSAHGPKPHTNLPPVPLNKATSTVVPDRSRMQDQVMLAETLGLNRFNPDYYALELGNHVLGGAFYATRLYRDLREQNGLVYYVGSSFMVGKTRGIYMVDFASDPGKVGQARSIIVRDLQQMREHPVSAAELRQAKVLVLREMSLAQASLDDIAGGFLHRERLGLPLDEPTRAARHYIQLTAAQVQAAYRKWIEPARLVQITRGPAPQ